MSVGGGSSGQNFCSSNAGFSGTPLWKLKQQGQLPNQWREHEEAKELQAKELREEEEAAATLRVAVDAVSLGRVDLNLVRHIVVKDLRKAAARSKIALPTGGLFENKAPLQLFALFDGQSAAEGPGPMAAECCAKALQPKLLRNMSVIPQGYENATFIKACLKKAFEDLDKEVLRNHPGVSDGCGGAVALLVGEKLFTAVCGSCELTLLEAGPRKGNKQDTCKAVNMGVNQGHFKVPEDQKFLQDNGGMVFPGEGGKLMTSNPQGATTAVSRSIGDRAWKGSMGGMPGSLKFLRSVPETRHTDVSWADRHIALVLSSTPVPAAIPSAQVALTISDFEYKPRAASGDIAHRAALAPQNANAQCTTIVVYFVPKDDRAVMEPAAKRAKKEAESVRLRHIVVRHQDCSSPFDPVRNVQVQRTAQEAEGILRQALQELITEAKTMKLPAGKKASTAALQPSPKFTSLCKDLSECTTAQKGGGMIGDLGWLQPDELKNRFGPALSEAAKNLQPGQWSDLASSEMGIHIFQRIA